MLPIKKRVDQHGRIAIGDVLEMSKIQPGDWVEVTPGPNKITIKVAKKLNPKGVVKAASGILKDRPELLEEMLRVREGEDDRPGTTLE